MYFHVSRTLCKTIPPSNWTAIFPREVGPQISLSSNEMMDLQVDYWTAGGKKESSKVNTLQQREYTSGDLKARKSTDQRSDQLKLIK